MSYTIMFYNLENLYDTIDDPKTNDDEFTPTGAKRWTQLKYHKKLENLSEVFSAVSSAYGGFPVVVGMSEVENTSVLKALASQRRMAGARYKVIHYESNDARGVDVGLFYRPDKFKLIGSEPVKLVLRSGREYIGRDILAAWGLLNGEMFCFYVCHFLSRRSGVDASAGFRRAGAETVRDHAIMMDQQFPGIKVVVMGDMNDCPSDESLSVLLRARRNIFSVEQGDYFNPFWALQDAGLGTSLHNHHWKLYDNIIVSRNMLETYEGVEGLRIVKVNQKHYAEIFKRNFMMKRGQPKRSYSGNNYQNGYSDHLPVLIKLNDR
ncbi:MAG: endonuclease/exonuclease/phosphatase family protein [Bacteroidales bacterium]|nr:endonuclease/exonuclease/phosphatase family protein [Bacteroidales bacterium]MDD4669412.1 endonuclease/exonuclease/phosphatase family protein [Bacteroidales bacterium]